MTTAPGPWHVTQPAHDPQGYDIATESGSVIASLKWRHGAKDIATLMASAPDLFTACEIALKHTNAHEQSRIINWPEQPEVTLGEFLRAALAKARGAQEADTAAVRAAIAADRAQRDKGAV